MADVVWLARRLKAMSIPEVLWRLSQKKLQKTEEKRFRSHKQSVTDALFNSRLNAFKLNASRMHLNLSNKRYSLNTAISLLGGYNYEKYKDRWNAGFQTDSTWPDTFSYLLEYKQRDDIGDARTNWELNRHFQFAILAKNYMATSDANYLQEFQNLFYDWNEKNPFLWGISWTSVMEVAIRCSNWCFAYCFLAASSAPEELKEKLQTGILNMTDYIANHYSRYSSANNHLIVEAYAIGQSGILFDNQHWIDLAVSILTRELLLQNYSDGVNKELSLHYQSFYMEAMGLLMRLMKKNGVGIPAIWNEMLDKMCCYLSACIGDYGETVEFGDNDEGKILDLNGDLKHYRYVLELFSILLDKQYCNIDENVCENINWLFSEDEIRSSVKKKKHIPQESICYKEGGNTILRSSNRKILIGIDHAALGFGSIAAHGHADALSFQMYVDGMPVFVDPGTYIYHCDLPSRNAYRKTENHNTVSIDGKDQSEMLGAFLWGKKAESQLLSFDERKNVVILKARNDGYKPVIHTRTYAFDKRSVLTITDELNEMRELTVHFILAPGITSRIEADKVELQAGEHTVSMKFLCNETMELKLVDKMYSKRYGIQEHTGGICVTAKAKYIKTEICVN